MTIAIGVAVYLMIGAVWVGAATVFDKKRALTGGLLLFAILLWPLVIAAATGIRIVKYLVEKGKTQ